MDPYQSIPSDPSLHQDNDQGRLNLPADRNPQDLFQNENIAVQQPQPVVYQPGLQPQPDYPQTPQPSVPQSYQPQPSAYQNLGSAPGVPQPAIPQQEYQPQPQAQFQSPTAQQLREAYQDIPVTPGSSNGYTLPTRRPRKKKFLIIGGIVTLLVLLGGGAVFGLYLPNTPNNVWSTAINRSGTALDSLVTSSTDTKKLEAYKTSEISSTAVATLKDGSYSGNISAKFDQSNLDAGFDLTLKDTKSGEPDKHIGTKILSEVAKDSTYPNVYFQVSGIKALGLDQLFPTLAEYDGKWLVADAAYLKSESESASGLLHSSATPNDTAKPEQQITSGDIAAAARTASSVTKDYLFNTSKDKAVFVKKSFVAKEKVDGLNTYHYKVGVDTAHAKDYCVALHNSMLSTTAYKKISSADDKGIADAKKQSIESCKHTVDDNIKSSDTYDLWIDSSYKLIYKIRVYDEKDRGTYSEIGQLYKGGDQLTLFVAYHNTKDKSDGKFTLEVNKKTSAAQGTLTFVSTDQDKPYDIKLTLEAKASNDAVKIAKPANPTPVKDLLDKLGFDPSAFAAP